MKLELSGSQSVSLYRCADGFPRWIRLHVAAYSKYAELSTASIAELRTIGQMIVSAADEYERADAAELQERAERHAPS